MILTHIGPDDPLGFHHLIPALLGMGSGVLAYVYLFWTKIRTTMTNLKTKLRNLLNGN
jgi:hypothetical protein